MRDPHCRKRHMPFATYALLFGAIALGVGCESATLSSPTSPSTTTSAESGDASLDASGGDGGRLAADIVGAGWSGSCTVHRRGTRGRLKAVVKGNANTVLVVEFFVNGYRTPVAGNTGNNGTLRTSWVDRTMAQGDDISCDVMSGSSMVATTGNFNAP